MQLVTNLFVLVFRHRMLSTLKNVQFLLILMHSMSIYSRKKFQLWGICLAMALHFSCSTNSAPVPEEGVLPIDGVKLYYKTIGTGEPIVVVHGGPGLDHSYFLPQMAELAQTHKLIFYDQRLSGRSAGDLDSADISLDKFVEDIEGIRRAFELDKMNLMAHSWGALLAMKYAIRYPQHLESLLLVSSVSASSALSAAANQRVRSRFTRKDSLERVALLQSQAFQNQDPQVVAALMRIGFRAQFHTRSLADSLTLVFQQNYFENSAKLRFLRGDLASFDLHEQLEAITSPTLIVHGDFDGTPLAHIRKIHENIPNSQLVVLDECGHFPFVECGRRFFSTIRSFLADIEKR